jgi:transposase
VHLTDHDLLQLDRDTLARLDEEALRRLSGRLLDDLKEARDRLNQDSKNSSRPPSSDSPYGRSRREPAVKEPADEEAVDENSGPAETLPAETSPQEGEAATHATDPSERDAHTQPRVPAARAPGRQPGAPGHGRQQSLAITDTLIHRPTECACCGQPLGDTAPGRAYGGYDEVDLLPAEPAAPGLVLSVIRHLPFEVTCACGHRTRYRFPCAKVAEEWQGAGVDRQQLLGPRLAALVVLLSLRYRLSRAKLRELLQELTGLELSLGLIDQTLRQSAGQVAPVEAALLQAVEQSPLLHVDETGWPEGALSLWFWVFCAVDVVVYWIGSRAKEMFVNALPEGFTGWLMSDGYGVYRHYANRLRCWAHLLRKARGLAEATCRLTREVGGALLALMGRLIQTVQAAGTADAADLAARQTPEVERLKALCESHQDSSSEKLGAFCREMLKDWTVIIRPLYDPELPLTNNVAERQLRHWVVARKTCFGTRSEQGSRALALLSSIIDTCRLRQASAWDYLAEAIRAGRAGLPMPALPAVGV